MAVNTSSQEVAVDQGEKSPVSHVAQHNDYTHEKEVRVHDLEGQHAESPSPPRSTHSRHGDASSSSSSSTVSSHHGPERPTLTSIPTNVSLSPDTPAAVEPYTSFTEVPDARYDVFSPRRKLTIVVLLSFCAFLAPISSTTVLSATPEVAAEFGTSGSVVDVTNALYLFFMGVSPIVWGPFSEVWGRKVVSFDADFLWVVWRGPVWKGGCARISVWRREKV